MTAPKRRWSFFLRALFGVVTACAVAAPLVPTILSRIEAWQHPPKQAGSIVWMAVPRGVTLPLDEEDLLTEETPPSPRK